MFLEKGNYRYQVSKWGFTPEIGEVKLNENRSVTINLKRPSKN
jgi:hypothetical protein